MLCCLTKKLLTSIIGFFLLVQDGLVAADPMDGDLNNEGILPAKSIRKRFVLEGSANARDLKAGKVDKQHVYGKVDKKVDKQHGYGKVDKKKVSKTGKKGKKNKKDGASFEERCTSDLFEGTYLYVGGCGKGFEATITCNKERDACSYSERVIAQDACPDDEFKNEEEEEDLCTVGGYFVISESITFNAESGSCELSYVDLANDICDLYPEEEGGLGMKAAINSFDPEPSQKEMLIWFTSDSGDTYYNEEDPRVAKLPLQNNGGDVVDTDQNGAGRALSNVRSHTMEHRRRLCKTCAPGLPPFLVDKYFGDGEVAQEPEEDPIEPYDGRVPSTSKATDYGNGDKDDDRLDKFNTASEQVNEIMKGLSRSQPDGFADSMQLVTDIVNVGAVFFPSLVIVSTFTGGIAALFGKEAEDPLKQMEERMNDRFDAIEERFDKLELDQADKDGLQAWLNWKETTMDEKLNNFDGRYTFWQLALEDGNIGLSERYFNEFLALCNPEEFKEQPLQLMYNLQDFLGYTEKHRETWEAIYEAASGRVKWFRRVISARVAEWVRKLMIYQSICESRYHDKSLDMNETLWEGTPFQTMAMLVRDNLKIRDEDIGKGNAWVDALQRRQPQAEFNKMNPNTTCAELKRNYEPNMTYACFRVDFRDGNNDCRERPSRAGLFNWWYGWDDDEYSINDASRPFKEHWWENFNAFEHYPTPYNTGVVRISKEDGHTVMYVLYTKVDELGFPTTPLPGEVGWRLNGLGRSKCAARYYGAPYKPCQDCNNVEMCQSTSLHIKHAWDNDGWRLIRELEKRGGVMVNKRRQYISNDYTAPDEYNSCTAIFGDDNRIAGADGIYGDAAYKKQIVRSLWSRSGGKETQQEYGYEIIYLRDPDPIPKPKPDEPGQCDLASISECAKPSVLQRCQTTCACKYSPLQLPVYHLPDDKNPSQCAAAEENYPEEFLNNCEGSPFLSMCGKTCFCKDPDATLAPTMSSSPTIAPTMSPITITPEPTLAPTGAVDCGNGFRADSCEACENVNPNDSRQNNCDGECRWYAPPCSSLDDGECRPRGDRPPLPPVYCGNGVYGNSCQECGQKNVCEDDFDAFDTGCYSGCEWSYDTYPEECVEKFYF